MIINNANKKAKRWVWIIVIIIVIIVIKAVYTPEKDLFWAK